MSFGTKLVILSFIAEFLQTLLYPVIIYQGNSVRKNARMLSESKGARMGRTGHGESVDILILGDSAACGVGVEYIEDSLVGCLLQTLKTRFQCKWKIMASSGFKTDELSKMLMVNPKESFEIAILTIGINDITAGRSAPRWKKQIINLGQILRKDYKVSTIIFCGIPPIKKLTVIPFPLKQILSLKAYIYNLYLKEVCRSEKGAHFVSHDFPINNETMATDLLHPGKLYYELWAQKISNRLLKIFEKN